MKRISTFAAVGLLAIAGAGCAQGPGGMGLGMGPQGGGPRMGPDHTPGWHMMNQAERDEHHRRMLAARSPEECRQIMGEHQRRMQERAGPGGMRMPPQDACAGMR